MVPALCMLLLLRCQNNQREREARQSHRLGDSRWLKLPAGLRAASPLLVPSCTPAPSPTGRPFNPVPVLRWPAVGFSREHTRGWVYFHTKPPRRGQSRREAPPSREGDRPQRPCPERRGRAALPAPLLSPARTQGRGRESAARPPGLLAPAAQPRSAPCPGHPGLHPAAPAEREAPPPLSPTHSPELAARQHRPLPATETHLQAG